MKVTRMIREYVEEQVSKAYALKQNPYSKQAEIDRQKLIDFEETLRTEQRTAIEKFLSENELFIKHWGEAKPATVSTSTPSFKYHATRSILNEETWREENKKAERAKVREIILALELGANAEELKQMIAKLLEDHE